MRTKRSLYQFLAPILALTVLACSSASENEARIVAIGDLHGDLEATRSALRLAGAIDEQDHWIGENMTVVQTGDQLDRGDDEQAILDLFESLKDEAAAAGGAFHALLGNHELMNIKGDLRYVTEVGFQDFEDAVEYDPADTLLAAYEPHQRARMAALLPGRPYAMLLAERSLILQVGENVFVHGGVLPEHVEYGIDRVNEETRAWLRGETERPEFLSGSESPQWTRLYSDQPDSMACVVLHQVLDSLDATRIIVSHTIQEEGITSHCDGAVWCIDVGMAAAYGGPVEVLEIQGDSIRVLRAKDAD
jgi:hypothetical protein